jgi:hypothetical protein
MNNNYYTIEKILKDYSDLHPLLKGSYLSFDDQRSKILENIKELPVLYGVVRNISREEQTLNWSLRVYCLDLLLADRTNEKSIMNSTFEILNDLYNYIQFSKLPFRIKTLSFQPLNNFDNNRMNGWFIDLSFETKSYQCLDFNDGCLPPPPLPINELQWELVDTDGNVLQSGVQPCGEDLTIIIDLGE